MVDVIWSVYPVDSNTPIATNQLAILPAWAEVRMNDCDVAKKLCVLHFDREVWNEWFGADDYRAKVRVEIFAPAEVQGVYEVELKYEVIASTAKRLETTWGALHAG